MAKKAHPGFQKVAKSIAKHKGIAIERASAELASSTRRASPKAKSQNPNLRKVKG